MKYLKIKKLKIYFDKLIFSYKTYYAHLQQLCELLNLK